jgi:hypothetical protein
MHASTSSHSLPQLPSQPILKPNNGKPSHPTQDVKLSTYPTYVISSLEFHDIHVRSGKTLTKYKHLSHVEYLNEYVQNKEPK